MSTLFWFVYDTEYPDEGSQIISAPDEATARVIGAQFLDLDTGDLEHVKVEPCDPYEMRAEIAVLKQKVDTLQDTSVLKEEIILKNADLVLEKNALLADLKSTEETLFETWECICDLHEELQEMAASVWSREACIKMAKAAVEKLDGLSQRAVSDGGQARFHALSLEVTRLRREVKNDGQ